MLNRFGVKGASFAAVLFGGAAIGAILSAPGIAPTAEAKPIVVQAPAGAPLSFADLVERVSPAVVSVNVVTEREVGGLGTTEEFLDRFRGLPGFDDFLERRRQEGDENGPRTREGRSLGSGFFISDEGYVVTNNHVIDGAKTITLALSDGTEVDAELVGTDPQTDLAVLKTIDDEDTIYPYVQFADPTEMRIGDWVVAVGNPFGLGGTATAGIISADGRTVGGNSPYTDFLQIDASINRGNSGGPTFNLRGEVIGVNTAIFSPTGGSVGIGFAIPSDLTDKITGALIKDGRVSRGWLGVSIQDFTEETAEALGITNVDGGAIVGDVNPVGPALKAGIKRWDVIVEVNGREVQDTTGLQRLVGDLLAGSDNEFVVVRDGERQTINVRVGDRPDDLTASVPGVLPESEAEEGGADGPLGMSLEQLDDETREALGLGDDESGLVITSINADSPVLAAQAQLRPGMVILEVNGRPVDTVEALEEAIEVAKSAGREQALLAVRAGRATTFRTVAIDEE